MIEKPPEGVSPPVGALFVFAGLTEHWALGHAIEIVTGGGLIVAWLTGAVLELARERHGRVGLTRALGHAAAAALAVVALSWIALTQERLLDMLLAGG